MVIMMNCIRDQPESANKGTIRHFKIKALNDWEERLLTLLH